MDDLETTLLSLASESNEPVKTGRSDPDRCPHLMCSNKRMPGHTVCENHYRTPTKLKKLGLAWQGVEEIKDSKHLLDTDENVAFLEVIQQRKMETCKLPLDIALQSADLAINEERIIKAKVMSHKLALARGKVMDQSILMSLIDEISLVIKDEVTKHIQDENLRVGLLEVLSQQIVLKATKALDAAVTKATNESET